MTATAKRANQYERIAEHGRNLLAIFPSATERDPVKLCKKLRRLEREGNALGLRLCNGPEMSESEAWETKERILTRVQVLLGYATDDVPVFLNQDPRGYALKIDDKWMRENQYDTRVGDIGGNSRGDAVLRLHRDWGGYGIIAPQID